MSDTQWPLFEVFQQNRVGKPHRNVGSVHAPDAELALLNARDVFVRRPKCLSLWVAPSHKILSKTAQELADGTWLKAALATEQASAQATAKITKPQAYYIFQKQSQKASDAYVTYVGELQANSAIIALSQALKTFTAKACWVWWICPAQFITRSEDDDLESMFEPALDKAYRHQNYYHTVTAMKKLKRK